MRTLLPILAAALVFWVGYATAWAEHHDPADAAPLRAYRLSAKDAYWALERRYWAQEKAMGRLGATVRRLRAEKRAWLEERRGRIRLVRHLQSAAPADGVSYAIRLASSVFHVSEAELRAVAACETGGSFSPRAYNPSSGASGLLQFLPSTWEREGLAGFSVFDPIANALAAARIVAREGWRQWSCQP